MSILSTPLCVAHRACLVDLGIAATRPPSLDAERTVIDHPARHDPEAALFCAFLRDTRTALAAGWRLHGVSWNGGQQDLLLEHPQHGLVAVELRVRPDRSSTRTRARSKMREQVERALCWLGEHTPRPCGGLALFRTGTGWSVEHHVCTASTANLLDHLPIPPHQIHDPR